MSLNPEIFREYDIRGIVGKDIDAQAFGLLGKAFGTYCQRNSGNKVAVGRDIRLTSTELSKSFISGLLSTGCDVTDLGIVATPMVYYSSFLLDLNATACITASHNPREYNGVKLTFAKAVPVYGKMLQELMELIEKEDFMAGKGLLESKDISQDYIKMISSKIKLEKPLDVVVDCGNGVAGTIAKKLFKAINCNAEFLFEKPDGTFPNHLPDPTQKEYLTALIEKCRKENKLGIAFDGDVDRIGVVSEKGEVIWADLLMVLYSRHILKENPNAKIILEVKCSQALADEIKKHGGEAIVWKAGHSLIKAKMKETNALLAGELSGHMFIAYNYFGFDDAFYAAALLLDIISSSGKTITELLSDVPKYVNTPEIRVDCPDSKKFDIVASVRAHFIKKYPDSVIVDGIRIVYSCGWSLLRASNTQPKLILRFEAKKQEQIELMKAELIDKLSEFLPGIELPNE